VRDIVIRDALLLALASVAGCVDAISYLDLGGIFTANMTGHAVLLGMAAIGGKTARALLGLVAIAAFFSGALAAGWIVRNAQHPRIWPATVTRALAMESAVLALAAVAWYSGTGTSGPARAAYVAAAGLAMGAQSAAALALEVRGVATTYVSGTLTRLAADVVHAGATRSGGTAAKSSGLLAAVWLVYVVGAAGGTLLHRALRSLEIAIPAAVALLVLVIAAAAFGLRDGE
jgi:uncharacterized membrane protein YoaK (UPF0700 family)